MSEPVRGSVLVVVMNRDDRRALFETFDAHEFDAIYTAKDFAQAHAFLTQAPRLDVVLLEFAGDATEALGFLDALRALARAPLPVVGIADPATMARHAFERPASGVSDWLRSPVLGPEALLRVQRALSVPDAAVAPVPASAAPSEEPGGDAYRTVFEGLPLPTLVWELDRGLVIEANPAYEQLVGSPRARLRGVPFDSLDPALDADARAELRARLRREGSLETRMSLQRGDGRRTDYQMHGRLVVRNGAVLCVSSFAAPGDSAALRRALSAATTLARAGSDTVHDVAMALFDAYAPERLWFVAQRADAPLEVLLALPHGGEGSSPDFGALMKRLGGETLVVARDAARLLPELGGAGLDAIAAAPLLDERRETIGAVVLGAARGFADTAGLAEVLSVAGSRLSLALELERAREQGRAKGLQDSLTSLPNRLLFNDRLETTIKEAHRTGEMFAVLFVDLDRFKTINDSLGHATGDEVLIGVAKRLRASVRGSDTVARYAGDEFTLILRHIVQRDDVLRIAEKICRVLEAPITCGDGRELHITASIGVSFYPDDSTSGEKLLQHADVAMYSAKGMGRNTYQTYVAVPEESHQQRLALEAKLRQAERNNELRVYYQPQVGAVSEDIVGMEALIRWEHPELGMISPGFFIPLAEETGLIVSIGEWVLRQACTDAHRWTQRFGLPLRLGVNLSALQLRQPNLVEIVARALAESQLDPTLLELEVTESMSVKSIPNLLETLQALRELGCRIAIDDFGTGQSSLDYIRRFPADRIKIDQVFVRNIGVDPDDEAIVRATIHMAHNLNLHCVAEGVEYEDHANFLREHGCEELQGYLFCRPLPATSFENLLAERERLLAGVA